MGKPPRSGLLRSPIRLVLAVGLVVTLAFAGARWYLTSRQVADQVASRLTAILGVPVTVESVDLGLGNSSSVTGLCLRERDAPTSAPWLTVARVDADVSAWQLSEGDHPSKLTMTGAALTLRFDAEGNLLTRLPDLHGTGAMPAIKLEGATVTIRQTGHPDLVMANVTAHAHAEDTRLLLDGDIADPYWGKWRLAINADLESGHRVGTLATANIHLTQEMLDRLPFVSEDVWKQVQFEGDTPVELTLRLTKTGAGTVVSYRVWLKPRQTKLYVSSIDLHATDVQGKVVIEDGKVRLQDVVGQTADGTIQTSGLLDFRAVPNRLQFAIGVERVKLQKLPKSWDLPPPLEGNLSGKADLVVTIKDEQSRTTGEGEGKISDAKVLGFPAEPIRLRMHMDGDRPKFEPLKPEARGITPKVGQTFLSAWQAGKPAPRDPSAVLDIDMQLDDVDIAELAKRANVELPIAVHGSVSVKAHLSIPVDRARDQKAYRLTGQVSIPELRIEKLDFRRLTADVDYADGVLRLKNVVGNIPDPKPPASALLRGSARLELVPVGNFDAGLDVDRFPLALLTATAQGTVDLRAEVGVSLQKVRDLTAWKGKASASSDRVRFDEVTLHRGAINASLESGVVSGDAAVARVTVHDTAVEAVTSGLRLRAPARLELFGMQGKLFDGDLAGGATIPLTDSQPGCMHLRCRDANLTAAVRHFVPLAISGQCDATAELHWGPGDSRQHRDLAAHLEAGALRFKVAGLPFERGSLVLDLAPERMDYRARAEGLGGRVGIDGVVSTASIPQTEAGSGRVRVERVSLARLWNALGVQTVLDPLRGVLDAEMNYRQEGPARTPVGSGRVLISQAAWHKTDLPGGIRADVRVSPREIRVGEVTAAIGEGVVRGQALVPLGNGRPTFTVAVERVDASKLLSAWPDLASRMQGPVEVQLRGQGQVDGWSASGHAALLRGKVMGVEVSDWRLPIDLSYSTPSGMGRLDVRESSAQVTRGRAMGQVSLNWGNGVNFKSQVRFLDVDVGQVFKQGGGWDQAGGGRMTGRVDLSATNYRTEDDLSGTVDVRFDGAGQQSRLMDIPVLRVLAPYLTPGQAAGTFRTGEGSATLSRGVVRVQHLSLHGNLVQLYLEGSVTLQGRLDLEANAGPGRAALDATTLALLAARLPLRGPLPVALAIEATRYLSTRLVRLRVTGTVRNPSVQVVPLSVLTDGAVRFFLSDVP